MAQILVDELNPGFGSLLVLVKQKYRDMPNLECEIEVVELVSKPFSAFAELLCEPLVCKLNRN